MLSSSQVNVQALKDIFGKKKIVTRFAPSPTGFLHLGHLAHVVYIWAIAEATAGKIVLRMEDHDQQRSRLSFEADILNDLDYFGFLSSQSLEQSSSLYRQSDHRKKYDQVLSSLTDRGLLYPCLCTRKQLLHHPSYPGTCRDRPINFSVFTSSRFDTRKTEMVSFREFDGWQIKATTQKSSSDFNLLDKSGNPTYQLCVVVDDIDHGVNLVIRGADLFESTASQICLWQRLSKRETPIYVHHPLVLDNVTGQKLSKRKRSESLLSLRDQGMSRSQIFRQVAIALKIQKGDKEGLTLENLKELIVQV